MPYNGGTRASETQRVIDDSFTAAEVRRVIRDGHFDGHTAGIAGRHPDFGGPVDVLSNELPVFWACGVTPQVAIERARPELCITHAPGPMLITDMEHQALATFAMNTARLAREAQQ